jgi:hypothetical protein
MSQGPSSCLLALGSSGAATSPDVSGARLPTQGSSRGITCPHGSGSRLPARGSFGGTTCCLGFSTRLLVQGSYRATTCPMGGIYKLQAIKQISSGDPVITIFIGACARVSSKALCDKGCSTRLQGMQRAAH